MKLQKGKIPPETLKKAVFRYLGAKNSDVILGPALGVDGALVKVGDKVLISSMDPITGAEQKIGWLAVNVNANDVATFGVQPAFFTSCLLMPEKSSEKTVEKICRQIDSAAKKSRNSHHRRTLRSHARTKQTSGRWLRHGSS